MVDTMGNAVNILSLSLIFALISLSAHLTMSIIKVTDITCDNCVTLGGCVYSALIVSGASPVIALAVAAFSGICVGTILSSIFNHIKTEFIIGSIIVLSILQTLNVKLSYIIDSIRNTLHKSGTTLVSFTPLENLIMILVVTIVVVFLLYNFLNSEYGLAIRVASNGIIISETLGVDMKSSLSIVLAIADGMAALGGAMMAQVLGRYSSVMGSGALVFGIASVIFGQRLSQDNSFKSSIINCLIAAILFRIAVEIIAYIGGGNIISEYDGVVIAISLIFVMMLESDEKKSLERENF